MPLFATSGEKLKHNFAFVILGTKTRAKVNNGNFVWFWKEFARFRKRIHSEITGNTIGYFRQKQLWATKYAISKVEWVDELITAN